MKVRTISSQATRAAACAGILALLLAGGAPACSGTEPSPTPVPTPTLDDDAQNAFGDADDDGSINSEDCDDESAAVHPGATETCDAVDEDCDGSTDEGFDADGDGHQDEGSCATGDDCDDADPFTSPDQAESCDGADQDCDETIDESPSDGHIFYPDVDEDGFGDPTLPITQCSATAPAGAVEDGTDCDDTDPEVGFPDSWYTDQDGDGFGDDGSLVQACEAPSEDHVADGGDCDDEDPARGPGAAEVCDGVDQDCDGEVDERVQTTYYADDDGDGYGDPETLTLGCSPPATGTWVTTAGDCDDGAANVNTGMTDFCNDVDDDCDGLTDEPDNQSIPSWSPDEDGDGYGNDGNDPSNPAERIRTCDPPEGYVEDNTDCDDEEDTVYPGATEVCNDGVDQDCSGADRVCD